MPGVEIPEKAVLFLIIVGDLDGHKSWQGIGQALLALKKAARLELIQIAGYIPEQFLFLYQHSG